MNSITACLRSYSLSKLDLLSLVTCLSFLEAWHYFTFHRITFSHTIFCIAILYILNLSGRVVLGNCRKIALAPEFNSNLLVGFFIVSTLLYLSALVLPVGLKASVAIITAAIMATAYFAPPPAEKESDGTASYLCLLVVLTAVTLWTRNSLSPIIESVDHFIFKPWADAFYHATHIRIFGNAEGIGSIADYRMSAAPAPFYHAASYLIPAAINSMTSTPAYGTYTSFWLPFGLFLSGIGAYTFGKSIWGGWPGFIAATMLLLLPDTSQHGAGNMYFSYHWLQAVAPGGTYGVALMALVWLVMLQACKTGKLILVAASYLAAAFSIVYKAHFFVANAFLLMIFPPLFLTSLVKKTRAIWFCLSILLFVTVTGSLHHFDSLPTLKLTGSSAKHFLQTTYGDIQPGSLLKNVFSNCFTASTSFVNDIFCGSIMLFSCSVGLWGAAYLLIAWKVRAYTRLPALILPLLAIINFMIMAQGLSYNEGRGNADELLHRPFIWLYFLIVTWTGGAAYFHWFRNSTPGRMTGKAALAALIVALLAVPAYFGKEIENGPDMGFSMNNLPLPKGLVLSCRYLLSSSDPKDIVQDSAYDPILAVTALSERQAFVIRQELNYRPDKEIDGRVAMLSQFSNMNNEADIAAFARRHRIRWYLLHPGDKPSWPGTVVDHPVFHAYGYRVYRLF